MVSLLMNRNRILLLNMCFYLRLLHECLLIGMLLISKICSGIPCNVVTNQFY